jgi:hypothetical protein
MSEPLSKLLTKFSALARERQRNMNVVGKTVARDGVTFEVIASRGKKFLLKDVATNSRTEMSKKSFFSKAIEIL